MSTAVTESRCPVTRLMRWMTGFVAKPHPQLGRQGAVCPFILRSLRDNSISIEVLKAANLRQQELDQLVVSYAERFLQKEPTRGKARLNKAFILAFDDVSESQAYELIELTQHRLKVEFVERGLMLGEFHQQHQSPGVHNKQFRPLQSPVPMLVIRHMIPMDLQFLNRPSDSATNRQRFLRAFERFFGSALQQQHE